MGNIQMEGMIVTLSVLENDIEKFTTDDTGGQSTFYLIFQDVIEEFAKYYWVCPDGPFSPKISLSISDNFPDIASPNDLFPSYASWIKDNDNDMFGFEKKPNQEVVDRIYDGYWDENFILTHVDIFLSNVDGVFWECYAKKSEIVSKCIESAKKVVENKYVRTIDLNERKEFYKVDLI